MKFWYQPRGVIANVLRPLSWLYRLVVAVRRSLYRLGWFKTHKIPVPVIVVGNIVVGGSGKSPMVAWLVNHLKQRGLKPGIVSRGYGGRLNRRPTLINDKHEAVDVGDEALMLYRQTGVPVVVGVKRAQAARYLLEQADCDVTISDDGLQHYALARDLELIMVDAKRKFGNNLCLPAGPLREGRAKLRQTPWVIYTEGRGERFCLSLEPVRCYQLIEPTRELPLNELRDRRVHAVAGLANPERFFDTLKALKADVEEHPLPDHHAYAASDLLESGQFVVMTEKDAVKCAAVAHDNCWVLVVKPVLSSDFVCNFDAWLKRQTLV